jgi:hypothetical protein
MLRKMKAKVGEAISPRERNEIARAAVSSSPAEGYNLELYFASPGPSPSSSAEVESVPDACHSGMKRRPSVTIMEEWNEYYHDADGTSGTLGGGPRGTYASEGEEGTEKKNKVDPTSVLEAAQAEAQQGVEERGGEEYEEYGDDDDDENWEEGYIMVDVGSEKEVATRLPSTNGDDCMVGGEETGGEPPVPASAVEATAEKTKNDWKNGTIESSTPTKTVLATNISTDGEDEDDDDDDEEDYDVSDSSTEWDTTTTPEEGLPAATTAKSKPRFQLRIPQRKDPGMCSISPLAALPSSGYDQHVT